MNDKPLNILLVDDEDFVCQNLKLKIGRIALNINIDVVIANSANQAMNLIKEQLFDMIITDIRMPFISGITFTKMLRNDGFQGKIIVLSGYDDFEYVRTAFLNGADDYLLKPISIDILKLKLEKLLLEFSAKSQVEEKTPVCEPHSTIEYAQEYIALHYSDSNLTMNDVAAYISLSYTHFSNLFRKFEKMTFPAYLLKIRVEKAVEFLKDPDMKISDICYKCGFKYPQQFSRDFFKATGMYPSDYRKKILNME